MKQRASWTRRDFLRRSGVTAGALGLGATGAVTWSGLAGASPSDGVQIAGDCLPSTETIFGWISKVYSRGIRRPGYPADIWAERWIAKEFRRFGLENVHTEPITVTRWFPGEAELKVTTADGKTRELRCFQAGFTQAADDLELELAAYDSANPGAVKGKASLYTNALLRLPADLGLSASEPARVIDPDGTMASATHVLPFGGDLNNVVDKSVEAGAAAFIGWLKDYPGDSYKYFVPYDAVQRPIPGVWVNDTNGAWLTEQLAAGPVRVKLDTKVRMDEFTSHNVVGELPGADDHIVHIGSHHDGPWSSAVEDGSGIALVLAQVKYWSKRSVSERPHRLRFVLHGGHMSGGAGLLTYIEEHHAELENYVLELHLEHAALDFAEQDGELEPTGMNVPRWFFTSEVAPLETAVTDALREENLKWSLVLKPTALGSRPPTDGGHYADEGVPIVNFLAAPFYLFDKIDRLDKIDKANLVPLTRAAIRIVEATRGVAPGDWRQ